jgi:MoxR-like ATPase
MKTGRRVIVIAGTGELEYGRDALPTAERDRWFRESLDDLNPVARQLRAADPSRPVWALIDSDAWPRLSPEQRGAWEVIDRTKAAYLARLR